MSFFSVSVDEPEALFAGLTSVVTLTWLYETNWAAECAQGLIYNQHNIYLFSRLNKQHFAAMSTMFADTILIVFISICTALLAEGELNPDRPTGCFGRRYCR